MSNNKTIHNFKNHFPQSQFPPPLTHTTHKPSHQSPSPTSPHPLLDFVFSFLEFGWVAWL